jgi:hypothetical protein
MSEKVAGASHKAAKLKAAPTLAYVPIPEGSSSEEPVMSPGPSAPSARQRRGGGRRGAIAGQPPELELVPFRHRDLPRRRRAGCATGLTQCGAWGRAVAGPGPNNRMDATAGLWATIR